MTTASYWDPDRDAAVGRQIVGESELHDLVGVVLGLSSGRGHPALELTREDESTLSLATDGSRAFLVWVDSLGDSFHPVGTCGPGPDLVYDYFGSWSEASPEDLVPHSDAIDSARQFLRTGVPDTVSVIYTPE